MEKPTLGPIISKRLNLRLIKYQDLPLTMSWRNKDQIRRWFKNSERLSIEQHKAWYEKYEKKDNDFIFIIEYKQNFQRPVGQIAIYNIDTIEKRAEFGRLMVGEEEAIGKGLAKEASKLLINFSFSVFDIDQIYLEVFEDNLPAISVYKSCGFENGEKTNRLITMVLKK